MGVDRRLFISNRWRVEDIQDTLESLYKVKVKFHPTHTPDYVTLEMNLGKEENRSLNVHINYEHGGFHGTLVTLRAWGKSEEILKSLGERLGGFYNHEDFNDTWVEYQYPASGDLEYLLKDAIKTGKSTGRDTTEFRKYLDESDAKHKAWEEENQRNIDKLFRRGK